MTGASKFRCPGCRQSVMEQVLEEVFAEDFWGVLEANPVLNAAIDERPEVREAAVSLATTNRKLAEVGWDSNPRKLPLRRFSRPPHHRFLPDTAAKIKEL